MRESLGRLVRRMLAVPLGTLTGVRVATNVAALTFDDGPDPDSTPRVLDVLARHNAKATFFLVGKSVYLHPEVVRRIVQAGHEIGNHSFSHPDFTKLGAIARLREISRCRVLLAPFCPKKRLPFRPPFGFQCFASRLAPFLTGQTVVAWNAAPGDWRAHDANRLFAALSQRVRPGSIVLLHDSLVGGDGSSSGVCGETEGRMPMLEALDRFLSERGRDYEFVTVSELMRRGRPTYEWWSRSQRGKVQ